MPHDDDPWSTPKHRALVDELRRALDAGGGMGAIFRRERREGSACIPLVVAAREAFGISLLDAKMLSGYLESDPDERFDQHLLSTIDPVRWPAPLNEEDPLGLHRTFAAGQSVAARLREARVQGLAKVEIADVLRQAFGLSQAMADAIVGRVGVASDAEIDAALRDAIAR